MHISWQNLGFFFILLFLTEATSVDSDEMARMCWLI
jgi:hypothetical protein